MGGSNKNINLVLLTAREHFIAHLLLTKFTVGKDYYRMLKALTFMLNRQSKPYSKLYENIRQKYSISMSGENNPIKNVIYHENV